jgi:chemotaxis protein MotA
MGLNLGMVAMSIRLGGATVTSFLNEHASLVVVGGTVFAMVASYTGTQLKSLGRTLLRAFVYPMPSPEKEIERLVSFANLARREGLLALEELEEVADEFEAKGLRMVVDGLPAE